MRINELHAVRLEAVARIERTSASVRLGDPQLRWLISDHSVEQPLPDASAVVRSEQVDGVQLQLARGRQQLLLVVRESLARRGESDQRATDLSDQGTSGHRIREQYARPHLLSAHPRFIIEQTFWHHSRVRFAPDLGVHPGELCGILQLWDSQRSR